MNKWRPVIILAAVAALLALPVYSALGGSDDPEPPADYRVSEQTALGNAFTYQGRLTESNAPATGTYDLRFTIFGSASASAQVCAAAADDVEERGDVNVSGGLFTVQLEFCPEAFDGDARWLEIAVRAGNSTGVYTILSPRQPISPTPYALYAKQAEMAGGFEVPFVATGESSGIEAILEIEQEETTDPGPALEVDGAIRVSGNQAAFHVVSDAANVCDAQLPAGDDAVVVPDDIANEANDLLFVTGNGVNSVSDVGVAFSPGDDCPDDAWVIYTGDGADMPIDALFNVLVIKQEAELVEP
jgi:hypothetical protein